LRVKVQSKRWSLINGTLWALILTWNDWENTIESVLSLERGRLKPDVILVVDNGSEEQIIERLQVHLQDVTKAHLLRNESNLGFAAGLNKGIKVALSAGAQFAFLLNNDAIVQRECLSTLMDRMMSDRAVGLVGPRIFYHDKPGKIWVGETHYSPLKTSVVSYEKNKKARYLAPSSRKVSFLNGCAVLIRREVFESVGLFDEDYFFYSEDLDFSLRAVKSGHKLLYEPSASVWHKISLEARVSEFVFYNLSRSRLIFLRKHLSGITRFYAYLIHLGAFAPYRVFQAVRLAHSPLHCIRAWLQGTVDGLRMPIHPPRRVTGLHDGLEERYNPL
jgi:GT2 family glycosyltransferase